MTVARQMTTEQSFSAAGVENVNSEGADINITLSVDGRKRTYDIVTAEMVSPKISRLRRENGELSTFVVRTQDPGDLFRSYSGWCGGNRWS